MKRLMICLLMGCGASQGDAPETPLEPQAAAPTEATSVEAAPVLPAVERRLFPQKFSASSHLENDWNKFQENYLAAYLGDDNPATSWTEGKSDVGIGETVTVEHTKLDDATRLRLEIRNGYQKSPRLFARNARAKEITLKLLPSGATSKHTLSDAEGWQSISAEQTKGPLSGYQIQFDSVYKGSHYEDLVVSDIQTFVTAQTPDNPSFEVSKQKRLLDWVAERKLAAQTFKEAAKGSIPVAPNYVAVDEETAAGSEECFDDCPLPFSRASKAWGAGKPLFGSFEAAAAEQFGNWKQVRIAVTDKRKIPQADSFNFVGSWTGHALWYEGDHPGITMPIPRELGYLSSQGLKRVFVETEAVTVDSVLKGQAPGCKSKKDDADFFFTPTQEGPLEVLLIATCGLYEDREGYTSGSYWQILTYGADGQLHNLFDHYSAFAFSWGKVKGAPFLQKVARVSTAGAADTTFVAK